jgi:hypothetical protein
LQIQSSPQSSPVSLDEIQSTDISSEGSSSPAHNSSSGTTTTIMSTTTTVLSAEPLDKKDEKKY